jgi:hypothetical protein
LGVAPAAHIYRGERQPDCVLSSYAGPIDHEHTQARALFVVSVALHLDEILAETWFNVDPHQGRQRIIRSMEQIKQRVAVKEPKGRRSRSVILPSLPLEALDTHKKDQGNSPDLGS